MAQTLLEEPTRHCSFPSALRAIFSRCSRNPLSSSITTVASNQTVNSWLSKMSRQARKPSGPSSHLLLTTTIQPVLLVYLVNLRSNGSEAEWKKTNG
ncbi:hypothetical protein CPAR01_02278 [Colletotrichum paranaense]|uniref:Uncharacterized protein n=1 Tax=Colletotrichum paranaense TaxID=1914294 RepID=A0ABQ9T0S7_9PEZI|nr:uncharacterized protein CPAR01_02278 [Colletotrichum paranaense]KAK1544776.1 hypothetical protein CPAR01_02278 [Colletotrichum paranaense]